MATIEVTVCDICRKPELPTTRFLVTDESAGGGVTVMELCAIHASPLRTLLDQVTGTSKPATARKSRAASSSTRRKRTGFDKAVATMEEIEARKQL